MPFVNNNGTRIHYELVGEGPPLVMLHGYTGNLDRWHSLGYVTALSKAYELILIDARGHGQSDKPHNPEDYSWDKRTADVLSVLDSLGFDKANFFGFSLGGIYAFNIAAVVPARVDSLMVWGAHPYESKFNGFENCDSSDPDGFIDSLEVYLGENISVTGRILIKANDIDALIAAATDRASLKALFPRISMRTLVLAGTNDARFPLMKQCAIELPTASFVALQGRGHFQAKTPASEVLPHIIQFLTQH